MTGCGTKAVIGAELDADSARNPLLIQADKQCELGLKETNPLPEYDFPYLVFVSTVNNCSV